MQTVFDGLYSNSKAGKVFNDLYDLIISPQNVLLAYRNIKANTGSKTSGVNGKTIADWKLADSDAYVEYVQRRLRNYYPHRVRRKLIPKANGKTRPLGIPTIEDRLIQQCIKQILEPILEAKFHPFSFGFRPNRSTTHAIAEFYRRINQDDTYYVVDADIKGFFDNVDHGKLLKQLWTIGIRDKRIISIISKMLKAQIVEEDGSITTPDRGTPQGGILSPLLANVVLNELDWWIDGQWKGFELKELKPKYNPKNGTRDRGNDYAKMRKSTTLKEMYIIRYADDFKILCKEREDANRALIAVQKWLFDRLHLETAPEKSGVVDVREKPSEFLGFNIGAKKKGKKYVVTSHLSDKSKQRVIEKLRDAIANIKQSPSPQRVSVYNSVVLGQQNYYSIATEVVRDFSDIEYAVYFHRQNQLKGVIQKPKKKRRKKSTEPTKLMPSKTYDKLYGMYNYPKQFVAGICLFPVPAVKFQKPVGFRAKTCDYTEEGRKYIHEKLQDEGLVHYLMQNTPRKTSTELADARLSCYTAQRGRCAISGTILTIGQMELHHKLPKELGGKDEYSNLVWVTFDVHKLIHATEESTIDRYLSKLELDPKQKDKLNKYRETAGNTAIK